MKDRAGLYFIPFKASPEFHEKTQTRKLNFPDLGPFLASQVTNREASVYFDFNLRNEGFQLLFAIFL